MPPLFPEQASTIAPRVDNLYFFITAVSAFFALVVTVLVILFAIKYRRRHPDEVGAPIHGSLALELIWTAIPFVLAMVMFVWGASVYFAIARPPSETLDIYAVGKQWMWKFQHREGQREINTLHVPINTPVRMVITSEDVLHDLYLPTFRVKMDAIPGRYTQLWFTATKLGTYHLFCAEYCGTKHSGMIGSVTVMAQDELPDVAERRRDGRHARAGGREAVHAARVRHLPRRGRPAARARCSTGCSGRRSRWRMVRRWSRTTPTSASRS